MRALRDPQTGCPWDKVQTFETIAPFTIEEAYEVADAIERRDYTDLKDELGDLLLQVVYHAQMAEESGHFKFEDVVSSINDKMIRRHPHVFGAEKLKDQGEVKHFWENKKSEERDQKDQAGILAGIAQSLPALRRAEKLQKRASRVGFDWNDAQRVLEKMDEELAELKAELPQGNSTNIMDEMGDLLFVCVNLARHLGVNAEEALRACNRKFERRFAYIEDRLREQNKKPEDCVLDELDALWNQAKIAEKII